MTTPEPAQNLMPDGTHIQERVFAFLSDPFNHPNVRRIDTHAASVFLEGDRALKIKRTVCYPYLNYSTLAKRKAACEQEIAVNRQFAPQIYRRVIPITQDDRGSLHLDGEGKPVEFAIEMLRFDESQTLDRLVKASPPDTNLVAAIADAIVASHLAAPPVSAEPWIQSIPAIIAGNTSAFRAAARFPERAIDDHENASLSAYRRLSSLLEQRGRSGFVRRCHGDLHLANIALIEGKPVLFDAIEFDPIIASTDVLYDLAFPLMDFIRHDRHAAANGLLNRYLQATPHENLEALKALPLFMSLRAAIRANVLLARLDSNCPDKATVMQSARTYLELAQRLTRPVGPQLVAIGGLSGTGKSVLAQALAPYVIPDPGAVILRSDVLRKHLLCVNETDRLSQSAYGTAITEQVYETLGQQTIRILLQGQSIVVDAVFADQNERTAIRDVANKLGVIFVGLYLHADLGTRLSRVGDRRHDASDATPEIASLQEEYDIGFVDWILIDASGDPEHTLRLCRCVMGSGELGLDQRCGKLCRAHRDFEAEFTS